MRVLFLDFDGVLNSHESQNAYVDDHPEVLREIMEPGYRIGDQLGPALVERLNQIVEATGCHVVVSSTWRHQEGPASNLEKILRRFGYRYSVFDTTPIDRTCEWHDGQCSEGHRGGEINQWLIENSHIRIGSQFAIVDDGSDMKPHKEHLVQTNMDFGLQDEHVERIIAKLKEPDDNCTRCRERKSS